MRGIRQPPSLGTSALSRNPHFIGFQVPCTQWAHLAFSATDVSMRPLACLCPESGDSIHSRLLTFWHSSADFQAEKRPWLCRVCTSGRTIVRWQGLVHGNAFQKSPFLFLDSLPACTPPPKRSKKLENGPIHDQKKGPKGFKNTFSHNWSLTPRGVQVSLFTLFWHFAPQKVPKGVKMGHPKTETG